MSNTETRWGVVTTDEDEQWLGPNLIIELHDFYIVTREGSGFVARWVDENGAEKTRTFASRNGALNCVHRNWGA